MERPCWRMIRTEALSGAMNMALDEVLLQDVQAGVSPPVVRLYRWQPATVTLGYAQRGERQVNRAYCHEAGLDIVRRLTGGRAVLHDDEVTYSVISRQDGLFSSDPLQSYRTIAEVLLACLRSFGLDAQVSGRHAGVNSAAAVEQSACFTAPAQFEIVCDGKKVCGSSQKRGHGSFLQHGSLPVNMDLDKLFSALNTDASASRPQGIARLAEKVGWINLFRSSPCEVGQVEAQLEKTFIDLWPVNFQVEPPTSQELDHAESLAAQKYRHIDWHLLESVRDE